MGADNMPNEWVYSISELAEQALLLSQGNHVAIVVRPAVGTYSALSAPCCMGKKQGGSSGKAVGSVDLHLMSRR